MVSADHRLGLYISIPVYLFILACCAVVAHRRMEQMTSKSSGNNSTVNTLTAHYLGGRSLGPLVTAGTVFASLFSGYAVVGIPNEAFRTGWQALRWIPQGAAYSAGVAGCGLRLRK